MSPYYTAGMQQALLKLGIAANAFADFAAQDQTDVDNTKATNHAPEALAKGVDKTPAWSGQNSLEGGDAGTRNYQMGLPRVGGV